MNETSLTCKVKEANQDQYKASMEDLPLDISLDILTRLPITSLIRFKCVCKALYSLACHPWLAAHYGLHKNPCLIIHSSTSPRDGFCLIDSGYFRDKDDKGAHRTGVITQFKVPFMNEKCSINSFLSCQGLLCLAYSKRTKKYIGHPICIYNPLTREFKHLPDPGSSLIGENLRDFYGFGFHPISKEYKVIRILAGVFTYIGEKNKVLKVPGQKIEVFTLGTSEWRSVENRHFSIVMEPCQALVNGALNWLGSYDDRGNAAFVVSFNLLDEKLRLIRFPKVRYGSCDSRPHLGVLGGCLSLAVKIDSEHIDIWRTRDYGVVESWTKEFTIRDYFHTFHLGLVWPLSLLQNGELLILYNKESLFSYDPQTGRFKAIVTKGLLPHPFEATTLAASLISPFL